MKNRFSFVVIYFWLLVLLAGGLSLFAFAPKEERISEEENRMLSGFPELTGEKLLSGEFFTGIESYLSDGMFGRDSVVGVSEGILRMFSRTTLEDDTLLDERATAEEILGSDTSDDLSAEPDGEAPSDEGITDGGSDLLPETENDLPVYSDELNGYGLWLKMKAGGYHLLITVPEERIKQVTGILNMYKALLPRDGHVYYLHVPFTKTSYNLRNRAMYSGWLDNTGDCMELYADEGVHFVDTAGLMEQPLLDGEQMFFDSDHHWTPRNAVLALNECLRLQGTPAVPFEEYDHRVNIFSNSKLGTNDNLELPFVLQQVESRTIRNGVESEAAQPLVVYDYNSYLAYLGGDNYSWTKYTTGFSTGRNALVIGDSCSNVFTVYMMPYYDEVSKVDIRNFSTAKNGITLARLIEENDIDDVYVVVSHGTGFVYKTSYYRLEKMLTGE